MPSGQGTGTNPLHNKKPKKKEKDLDEDDEAYKKQQQDKKKAEEELRKQMAGKKGPMNTGQQGIKKSGKK